MHDFKYMHTWVQKIPPLGLDMGYVWARYEVVRPYA